MVLDLKWGREKQRKGKKGKEKKDPKRKMKIKLNSAFYDFRVKSYRWVLWYDFCFKKQWIDPFVSSPVI